MKSDYSDIIHLPHHVSKTHPQMSMHDRAAQFSPFAAMQELLDIKFQRLLEHLSEKPLISITFFCPDKRKQGGSYVSISGTVKKLDLFQRILTLEDGMQIFLDDIVSIEAHTSTTL